MLSVLEKHANLIVLQTFSKAWGMAGLRLGMAFAAPEVAELFARVKYPYNVNAPTQIEVMRRIEKSVDAEVKEICSQRAMMLAALAELPVVERVYPTDANFVLIKVADPNAVYDYLVSKGVIVRNRNRIRGCEGCLRITIGTPEENALVLMLLKNI